MRAANSERETLEARLRETRSRAAKARDEERGAADEELATLVEQFAKTQPEAELRLIAEDTTPEKLAALLAEQRGRMALFSDEGGGIFEMMRGRYQSNGRGNLDVYLKGYGGDEMLVDRKGSPPLHVRAPCLVVAVTVQPSVLDGLADAPELRGRGLLARLAYAIPAPLAGHRSVNPAPMPADVREEFTRIVKALCDLPEIGDDDTREIKTSVVPFTASARAALVEFSAAVETMLRDGRELEAVKDFGNRLPGTAARIAGIFSLWRATSTGAPVGAVDVEDVRAAVRIAREFLIPHALAAFGAMGADPILVAAKHILRWIVRRSLAGFTKREAFEGVKVHLPQASHLDAPLRALEDRGYLRRVPEPEERSRGRPGGPGFIVNPRWAASQKSQKP